MSARSTMLAWAPFLCQVVLAAASGMGGGDGNGDDNHDEVMRLAREQAKPWLMREFHAFGRRWFFSPATVLTLLVLAINLVYSVAYRTSGTWAEASHILITDTSNKKTLKALEDMRTQVGSNLKLFGELAEQYSQCPSKNAKGDLGRFSRGDMAPPFDRAVFDPASPTEMTLGPIETQFGYHLIYIRKRKLS